VRAGDFPQVQPLARQASAKRFVERQAMLVRVPEVASVLGLVLLLVIAKHVPALGFLPLTQVTGIVCFAFAIFLSLRLFQFELARIRAEE
jgi:hypothetical protein